MLPFVTLNSNQIETIEAINNNILRLNDQMKSKEHTRSFIMFVKIDDPELRSHLTELGYYTSNQKQHIQEIDYELLMHPILDNYTNECNKNPNDFTGPPRILPEPNNNSCNIC
jgi:hypothetical protein